MSDSLLLADLLSVTRHGLGIQSPVPILLRLIGSTAGTTASARPSTGTTARELGFINLRLLTYIALAARWRLSPLERLYFFLRWDVIKIGARFSAGDACTAQPFVGRQIIGKFDTMLDPKLNANKSNLQPRPSGTIHFSYYSMTASTALLMSSPP